MDQQKKDLLALFIISIIVAMIYMCISMPTYDPKTETGPKMIDLIFCFGPVIYLIIGPVMFKKFFWEIDINDSNRKNFNE